MFVGVAATLAITELLDHRLYPMHRLRVDGLCDLLTESFLLIRSKGNATSCQSKRPAF